MKVIIEIEELDGLVRDCIKESRDQWYNDGELESLIQRTQKKIRDAAINTMSQEHVVKKILK